MADGREEYIIGINTSPLEDDAQRIESRFDDVSRAAEESGRSIDEAFAKALADIAKSGSKLPADAIEALASLGDKFDLSSASGQIEALTKLTNEAKEKASELSAEYTKLNNDAAAAWDSGDRGDNFVKLTNEAKAAGDELEIINAKIASYTQAMEMLRSSVSAETAEEEKNATAKKNHDNILVKMLGGQEKYQAILDKLPPTAKMAVTEITGMTGAAKAFIATPLGIIIGAIVLALQAMNTWFNSTREGQLAFAQASGYLSGILGQLKEIVIAAGKAIYKAFSDPKKAVSELWAAIKKNLVNRVEALGEIMADLGKMMTAALTFNGEEVQKQFKSLTNHVMKLGTGVDDLGKKVTDYTNKVHNAAEENAKIAKESKLLQEEESKWQTKRQQMETKMADLQAKMRTGDANQRKAALAEYKKLVNEEAAMDQKLANDRINLQKRKMALTSNTMEDEDELRRLQTEAEAVKTAANQRIAALARLENGIGSLENRAANQADKAVDANEKYQDTLVKNARATARLARDLELQVADATVEAMEEGGAKELAALEQQYTKQTEELKRQREDYLQKKIDAARADFDANPNNKGKVFAHNIQLTPEELAEFDKIEAAVKAVYERSKKALMQNEADTMNDYLAQWGTYEQKRAAMIATAEKQIQKASTEGEKLSIKAQLDNDIAELDTKYKGLGSVITRMYDDLSKKSLDQLQTLKTEVELLQSMLSSGQYDANIGLSLGITEEQFSKILKSPEDLKNVSKQFKVIKEDIENLQPATTRLANAFKALFRQNKKDTNGAEDDTENWATSLSKLQSAIGDVMNAGNFLAGSIRKLGDAFGDIDDTKVNTFQAVGNAIQGAMDVMGDTMQGAQAGAAFGPWGAAAGAAIGLVTSLSAKIAEVHDAKKERQIARLNNQLEAAEKSYEKLEKAAEKAYSSKKVDILKTENANLQRQRDLIQKQIRLEEEKKSSDVSRIKDWKDQLDQLNEQIKDNQQAAIDAIFGSDIESAIDDFANKYAEAWANGTNKAASAKDFVRNMIKNMITESMKSDLAAPLEAVRKKLSEFWADGYIDVTEENVVDKMVQDVYDKLDRDYGWADKYMKGSSSSFNGTSGGFAAANQESVDALNGRFTAMVSMESELVQLNNVISANIGEITTNVAFIREDVQDVVNATLLCHTELQQINRNTKLLGNMSVMLAEINRKVKAI